MIRTGFQAALLLAVCCASAAALSAQDSAVVVSNNARVSSRMADTGARIVEAQENRFAIPESPAFTFLGNAPAQITRPSSWRSFSISLLSGATGDGRAKQGFALEVAPFQIIPGFILPLKEYQRSAIKRALYRTQISLGTAQASGDSGSTDVGYGIRIPLYDETDPMASARFTQSFGDALLSCAPDTPGGGPAIDCLNRVGDSAFGDYAARADSLQGEWRGRRIVLAAAGGTQLINSKFTDRTALGWTAWLVGSNPLGRWGMIVGSVEVGRRQSVEDAPAFSRVRYGGRALVGSSSLNGFLEVLGEHRFNRDPGVDKGKTSWTAGVEVKTVGNIWLSTGFGQRYDEAKPADRVVVIANLRWGIANKPRLTGPPASGDE